MTRDIGHRPVGLRELRRAFDESFAEAPASATVAVEDLLNVRLGARVYALRVPEISGLFLDPKMTGLPSMVSELIGIAHVRNVLLAVYDLRRVLGDPADARPRWVARCAASSVGIAFDSFEGHRRVPRDAIIRDDGGAPGHVRDVVELEGERRPIVSVPAVLETITSRVRAAAVR